MRAAGAGLKGAHCLSLILGLRGEGRYGQDERETRTAAEFGLHPNAPMVRLDYLSDNGQPQACADLTGRFGLVGAVKVLKQVRQILFGDPNTRVFDAAN